MDDFVLGAGENGEYFMLVRNEGFLLHNLLNFDMDRDSTINIQTSDRTYCPNLPKIFNIEK